MKKTELQSYLHTASSPTSRRCRAVDMVARAASARGPAAPIDLLSSIITIT